LRYSNTPAISQPFLIEQSMIETLRSAHFLSQVSF
jgi:hypothetical protein